MTLWIVTGETEQITKLSEMKKKVGYYSEKEAHVNHGLCLDISLRLC